MGNQDFLDVLAIVSFALNIANLNENLTQSDKQELMQETDARSTQVLSEIHEHLENQDKKIDLILERLEANNDNRGNI